MNPSILLDHEPGPGRGRHTVFALVNVEGDTPSDSERVPLNLSLVLDRSGSMSGPKLACARQAATHVMERLHPDDIASVVTFEGGVRVVCPAAARRDHHNLSARIRQIEPAGMTNLSGGWLEGRRQTERFHTKERSNRVLLMTDGLANQGIVDPDHLAQLFGEARASGVATSTIGFGADFDERLLERLADAGGGNTHYIEHPDQASAVFLSELDDLLTLSAQNLTADIRLEEGVEVVAIHHSYPRENHDRGVRLRLGDLYGSEPRQLLIELSAGRSDASEVTVAQVELSGEVLDPDGAVRSRTVVIPVGFSPRGGPVVHPEVRRTLAFLRAAAARRAALVDLHEGRTAMGAHKLRAAAAVVRERAHDAEGLEEAGDLDLMASHMEDDAFSSQDVKYTRQRAYDGSRSRRARARLLSRLERAKKGPPSD